MDARTQWTRVNSGPDTCQTVNMLHVTSTIAIILMNNLPFVIDIVQRTRYSSSTSQFGQRSRQIVIITSCPQELSNLHLGKVNLQFSSVIYLMKHVLRTCVERKYTVKYIQIYSQIYSTVSWQKKLEISRLQFNLQRHSIKA